MATYKYQQNVFEGSSYGYVKYNITPDLGTPIAPGETVTITGQAYSKEMAMKSIEFEVHSAVSNTYRCAYVNKNISKGSTGTFTIEFAMWELTPQYWGTDRVLNLSFNFCFWNTANAEGNGIGTMENSAQKVTYLAYRLSVASKNVQFERYALYGSEYRKDDEGSAVMGGFGITLPEGRTVSDITVATVHITSNGDDDAQTVTIPTAALTAALTENGYVETAPSLFADVEFDTAYNYTMVFTIGDAYNTYSFSVLVAKAFANVHMSGCPTGGVAFGKFSAASLDNPLFECSFPIVLTGSKSYGPSANKPSDPIEGQLYFVVE